MEPEYRIVQIDDAFLLRIVRYDEDGNIDYIAEPESFGNSAEELSHKLIYQMSAFTKPVLMCISGQNKNHLQTAIDMLQDDNDI